MQHLADLFGRPHFCGTQTASPAAPFPRMPRRRRQTTRYQYVQDCLTLALNEAVNRENDSTRDILTSMGHRLIAMAAAAPSEAAAFPPAHGHDEPVLFERAPAPAAGQRRLSPHASAEPTTAVQWLAEQNVAEAVGRCILDSGAPDDLASLRQLAGRPEVRNTLVARLQAGAGALAAALLPALTALTAGAAAPSAAPSAAALELPGCGESGAAMDAARLRSDTTEYPMILVVGAINVDVTAHVRGALDATRASTDCH